MQRVISKTVILWGCFIITRSPSRFLIGTLSHSMSGFSEISSTGRMNSLIAVPSCGLSQGESSAVSCTGISTYRESPNHWEGLLFSGAGVSGKDKSGRSSPLPLHQCNFGQWPHRPSGGPPTRERDTGVEERQSNRGWKSSRFLASANGCERICLPARLLTRPY